MRGERCVLLAFQSTHAAMEAQRALSPQVPVTVTPTLRQITAACGISLRVEEGDWRALGTALEAGTVPEGDYALYLVQDGEALPWSREGLMT